MLNTPEALKIPANANESNELMTAVGQVISASTYYDNFSSVLIHNDSGDTSYEKLSTMNFNPYYEKPNVKTKKKKIISIRCSGCLGFYITLGAENQSTNERSLHFVPYNEFLSLYPLIVCFP